MEDSEETSPDLPQLGDMAWAKIEGHPWWPSLVCNCPDSLIYTKDIKDTTMVHVYFYNSTSSRGWVKSKFWRPFIGQEDKEYKKGGMFYSNKKALQNAVIKAEKALSMTVEERLEDICKMEGAKGKKRKVQDIKDEIDDNETPTKKAHVMPEPIASTSSASQNPDVKTKLKRNRPGPLSFKKSLGIVLNEQETYKVDDADIPEKWKTPFVLMKAADIPENLIPTVKCDHHKSAPEENKGRASRRSKTAKRYVEDEEDDLIDSDDDPGWGPAEAEDEVDDDDFAGDSDEDPGWIPSKKKGAKSATTPKSTKKFGVSSRKRAKKDVSLEPKTSLKHSDPKAATSQRAKPQPKMSPAHPTILDKDIDPRNNPQPILLPPEEPPGIKPEIGDFMYEKSEYNDGNMPFLWKYKRSGLIQKFGRVTEKGKVLYESLLSIPQLLSAADALKHFTLNYLFSDWWQCYAHKYERIKVQVMFRYKTTEKVVILELPDGSKPPGAEENSTATTDTPETETESSTLTINNGADNTQEGEISSTTPEVEFQNGKFVLDLKDQRNVDNFPIWKIESNILLKKFEAVVKNGRFLHKAVKTYRGYKDIAKSYVSVKVKPVLEISGDDYVEVTEESRPKLDARNDGSYDNNPLLRHFYVYLQVFLSQALEPGFLDEIKKTKDTTYSFPLGEIDKLIKQKAIFIERKVRWTPKIKNSLMKCPYLREVPKPDEKKVCEAITDSEEHVEETVFLFGSEYDTDTLKSGESVPCQEFRVGKTAISLISHYHQLCHFKYNLYDRCLAKIKVIQETSKQDLEITEIMDSCLGNKAWVLQQFEDFMQLVELV